MKIRRLKKEILDKNSLLQIHEREVTFMKTTKKYWVSSQEAIPPQTRIILNEYLLSLKLANKAELTVSKYRSILEKFLMECSISIHYLTSDDVLNWLKLY